MKKTKLIIQITIFILIFYIGHCIGKMYEYSGEKLFIQKITWVFDNLHIKYFINFQFSKISLMVGLYFFLLCFVIYLRFTNGKKKYRVGEEHGSAKFATKEDLAGFVDKEEENNIIFSKSAKMGLYNSRLPIEKQLNKNVLVLGGPGSGKTFTFLKPNAMQFNSSKIFTDTKELLVRELGNLYEKNNYKVKVIDLINFENTNKFNPYKYVKKLTDIDKLAEAIVSATKKSDNKGEDFWVQAELFLMKALLGFVYLDAKQSNYTPSIPQINKLLANLKREDEETPSITEMLFEDLNEKLPNNYAYRMFKSFHDNFTGETKNSVLAIISSRFSVFEHEEVKRLLEEDNLEIEKWNTEKTAVFINIPEVNEAYQFISSMLFSTIFEITMKTADDIITGKLDKELIHLEIYADELAQIGKINNLSKYLAVLRSREISFKGILQGLPQLDLLYGKEEAKSIRNNMDNILYLGTNDKDTMDYISYIAGSQTIDDKNYSQQRGKQGGSTLQHSKLKREVITPHEVRTIDMDKCLVIFGKQNVFKDYKASIYDHKNVKYLASSPKDENWYRYKIYMNEIEEWISNVKEGNHIKINAEEIIF